jgi:hypothetical protein
MANYYGFARTNYVSVRDEKSFRDWASRLTSGKVITNREGKFAILGDCADSGMLPSSIFDEDEDDTIDIHFSKEFSSHLADGEVLLVFSAGAEKLRYISAYAEAWDHNGNCVTVSLSDIYEKARVAFGVEPNPAEY